MNQIVKKAARLYGTVELPSDKSIAHRSALLAALADGTSHIVGYPASADPQSTLACLRQLGVEIEKDEDDILQVEGRSLEGLKAPSEPLDCGNSGTTMRLLAGILAGQPFESVLTGDASLRSRPMERIADPLRQMGARIDLEDGRAPNASEAVDLRGSAAEREQTPLGCAPIRIHGGADLKGFTYRLPVASAQVKSCVLLAGLFAEGETTVIEPVPSRDHTERMLGLDVVKLGGERHLTVRSGQRIAPQTWSVPGDFSAAAFFLVAGSIVPESELRLSGVGLNPSRCALLDVLRAMGADITIENERTRGGEPLGDLIVRTADSLQAVEVGGRLIPNLIDEVPILAVAATQAEGRSEIRDAEELRVKETDRLAAITEGLRALGAEVEEREDGLVIEGPTPLSGAPVEAHGDHRIAMALGVAGLIAEGTTQIQGAEHARISFPGFWKELERLAM